MRRLSFLFFLLLLPGLAWAADGPQPPCAGPVNPAYGPVDGLPAVALWSHADLSREHWQPPACLGWQGDSRVVAALAARFHSPLPLDAMAERLAAVSHHPEIRFWAVTRRAWRPLVVQSWALDRPDSMVRRADPSAAELMTGRDFYYAEDAEVGGRAIWRFHVVERTPDRLVVATENLTPIRVALLTIFEPGALQVATVLQRDGADAWSLYEITRAGAASSSFVASYGSSYINRLDAMRRHLAGVPTDRDPPAAPW